MEKITKDNALIIKNYPKFKNKNPLVSVTIPAHNEGRYVGKCIESLLNQSYKPIEIAVVDDVSIDNTAEIVEKYKDSGVRLIKKKEQGGFGSACNAGAKIARGSILMFFDADQIYGKDYIKNLAAPIISGEDVCTIHHRDKIGNLDNIWARAFGERDRTKGNKRWKVFTLIRKDVFDDLGPFDPSLGYGDDQTLYIKHGLTSLGIDAEIYHFNPDSLKIHWNHGKWVGKSNKHPWRTLLVLPIFPMYVLYKSIRHFMKDPYWKFMYFLPIYYTVKYFSYFIGAIERLMRKKRVE